MIIYNLFPLLTRPFACRGKHRAGDAILIHGLLAFCLSGTELAAASWSYEERAVAAVLMGEAWSEGVRGMTAVAEVIHQRAKEKDRSPMQVVTKRRGRVQAFSCLNRTTIGALIRKFEEEADFQRALRIAKTVCRHPQLLPGITSSANHFTKSTERPYWAKGKRPVAVIGSHSFYKLKHY